MLTREQAHELLDLCLDINGEKKKKKVTDGRAADNVSLFLRAYLRCRH